MVDYDCPITSWSGQGRRARHAGAHRVEAAGTRWFGVRTMVLKREANRIMDELANIGAPAIVTSSLRSCRAIGATDRTR